jgi:hypothetical protein
MEAAAAPLPAAERYRRFAAARKAILQAAMLRVPIASIAQQARALSIWNGKQVAPGDEAQFAMAFDLGMLEPLGDHPRGLDRQAKAAPPEPGSDEAVMLEALQSARFGLWRLLGPHPEGGARIVPLTVEAPSAADERWLMDRYVAAGTPGALFGARIAWPAEFGMTCGVVAPVDSRALERLLMDAAPSRDRVIPSHPAPGDAAAVEALLAEPAARLRLAALAKDPMLTVKTYRHAIDAGLVGPVPGRTPPEAMPTRA